MAVLYGAIIIERYVEKIGNNTIPACFSKPGNLDLVDQIPGLTPGYWRMFIYVVFYVLLA